MIRKAKLQDINSCIPLIKMALGDIIYLLSKSNDKDTTEKKLTQLYNDTQNRISHKNMLVYEQDSKVVAMMISYKGSDVKWLDMNYSDIYECECNDDEYYIDAIAVNEKFQSQGIATKLFKYAEILAKEKNERKIALLVETLKQKNIQLYKKLGFKIDGERNIYNLKFYHMIKEIK
ncbi:GNAT family N-acetyltransferase [Campylobacter majalis]|uniref:GNAT family N-acetyltransferase n=1 Tax=Campylobacter majalis TaxID=2790656 RepID=UPI003D68D24E